MRQCFAWQRRSMSIGLWFEFWGPVDDHPGVPHLRQLYANLGRDFSGDTPKYDLTGSLLREVVGAVTGMRRVADRLEESIENAESEAAGTGFYANPNRQRPTHGDYFSSPDVAGAYSDFVDFANWAKALRERLSRTEGKRRVGLIPQLAEGALKNVASELYDRLRVAALDEAASYANYGTHVALIPYSSAPADVDDEGRLRLRIPDPLPSGHIYSMAELRFTQGRDAVSFVQKVMAEVEKFTEDLVGSFETAQKQFELDRQNAQELITADPAPQVERVEGANAVGEQDTDAGAAD
jgi:hypothetical protein